MGWFAMLTGMGLLMQAITVDSSACGPPTGTLSIIRIARKDQTTLDLCCTECEDPVTDQKYILNIKLPNGNQQVRNHITVVSKCVNFGFDIAAEVAEAEKVTLAMQLLDSENCPTSSGNVVIESFPALPAISTSSAGDSVTSGEKILLIEGDMKEFSFPDMGAIQPISNLAELLTYYIGDIPDSVTPCKEISSGVNFCDITIALTFDTLDDGPVVGTSILSYGYNNGADVSPKVSLITSSSIALLGSDTLHIIVLSTPPGSEVLCTSQTLEGVCEIDWPEPSSSTASLRLIGLRDTKLKESAIHDIPDRELLTGVIATGVIEARWLMNGDSDKSYFLDLSSVTPRVQVDCSQSSLAYCFGYFSDVSTGDYWMTVRATGDGTQKQIQSPLINVPTKLFKELHIHDVHTSRHLGHKTVLVGVCFNHANYDVDKIFSHYEFVLINEKGQWLKHYMITKDTEGDLCFSPYTISLMAFDISMGATLVVTQRAENGFNVLASGKTHVSFGTFL